MTEPVTELWTYGGKWVSQGRLRDRWVDPEGKDLIYAKAAGRVVGGIYEVKVTRTDEGVTISIPATGFPWTGKKTDDPDLLARLVKDDSAQRIIHTQMRRELRAGEDDELKEAIRPLKKYMRACRTAQERDAVLATILRQLMDAW